MTITAEVMNADRLVADPSAIDKLNQAVIKEFSRESGQGRRRDGGDADRAHHDDRREDRPQR